MKLESFGTILSDCTSKYNKIKKEDYLTEGQFPIIDQGQKFIGGYTNDGGLITDSEKELIIFGDHTKILKFIDFPIAIGADGVKVLHVNKEKADPRYIYYFLRSVKLTDAGYSRHFKFLKEIKIPVPENINDQIKIARLLNHVETLITQRKESIALLDELLKSSFLEMFGDPVKNEKKWDIKTIEQLVAKNKTSIKRGPFGGALKKEIFVEDGYLVYEQFHALNNDFSMARYFIDEAKFNELNGFEVKPNDIIISCSGVYLGKLAIVPPNAKKGIINQALLKLTLDEKIMRNQFFVFHFTHKNFKEKYFDSNRGAGIPNFPPMSDFKKFNFIAPPIELQDKFILIVEKVEILKKEYEASLKELENMYGVLSQKAFKGELKVDENKSFEKLDLVAELDKKIKSKVIKLKPTNSEIYKRTLLAAEIVYQLKDTNTLGHLKLQKMLYLCQEIGEMKLPMNFLKQAMGPYDNLLARSLDKQFVIKKWFEYQNGALLKYKPLENCGNHKEDFQKYFKVEIIQINYLINKFKKFTSNQIEAVATLYACWKAAIEQKELITDKLIITKFYQWSKEKEKFREENLTKALDWMRRNGVEPK